MLLCKLQKRVTLLTLASNMTFSLVCILLRRLLLGLFTLYERLILFVLPLAQWPMEGGRAETPVHRFRLKLNRDSNLIPSSISFGNLNVYGREFHGRIRYLP